MAGPPLIYTAFAAAPRWVILEWVLPDDATGVAVFRDPPPPAGAWMTGWISRNSLTDQSCEPDTTYTYTVCAYYGSPDGECSTKRVTTPRTPVTPTPPPPPATAAAVINPQATLVPPNLVRLSWGTINDPNTVKLKIYREGPDGRLLRYTYPPDPQPGPPEHFATMYWDLVQQLAADYRYTFTTFNRNGDSTSVSTSIRVPAPPPIPHLPGWVEPSSNIPHAAIGFPSVTAVSWAPDRVDVFWVNRRAPGAAAIGSGPNPDPAQITHAVGVSEHWRAPMTIRLPNAALDVAASSDRAGSLDVCYRSGDELWHTRWAPELGLPEDANGTGWAPPQRLGGTMASGPAAISVRGGRTDVFYRTPDGMLGRRWFADGQWHDEQKIAASIAGKPSVVSLNPAHLEVYYRTPAKRLAYLTSLDDGRTWLPEQDLGGNLATDPIALALDAKVVNVYYTPAGGVYLKVRAWTDGRWYDEIDESATMSAPPFTSTPLLADFGLAAVRTQPFRAFMFYAHVLPTLLYRRYR
ncbi:hypothetical protein AB0K00_17430 [Dactylosporangium sp. NPDC049525]|uniref:hypothetical protein n=1 Tax=Dactylosporangium sp. NPDC049525 TaxID=3154730 RepID=UPI0034280EC2